VKQKQLDFVCPPDGTWMVGPDGREFVYREFHAFLAAGFIDAKGEELPRVPISHDYLAASKPMEGK